MTKLIIGAWLIVTFVAAIVFHYTTRKAPAAPVPPTKDEREPAKFIPKKDVWKSTGYDYRHSSPDGAVSPIEPGDSEPPEPDE